MPRDEDRPKKKFQGYQNPNYTMVPDELFDEQLAELTGAELKVLLYIVRRTFGFKRDSDNISLSQLLSGITTRDGRVLDRGTGLSKKSLLGALRSLEEMNLIKTERRRSAEKGNEPTAYRLNVLTPTPRKESTPPLGEKLHQGGGGAESTPPLGEKLHQGGGGESTPSPWGKNYPTQETVRQETVEQQTVISKSNLTERRDRSKQRIEGVGGKGSQARQTVDNSDLSVRRPHAELTAVGRILQNRAETLPKHAPEDARTALEERVRPKPSAKSSSRQSTAPNWLVALMTDYSTFGLNDQRHVNSNIAQAHHLFVQSGASPGAFQGLMYQARKITLQRSGGIKKQPEDPAWQGQKLRAPYFFAVLKDLLGMNQGASSPAAVRAALSTEKKRKGPPQPPTDPKDYLSGEYGHLIKR